MRQSIQISQTEYNLHFLLGEGASSWVYRASRYGLEGKLEEPVAIKIFKSKNSVQDLKNEYTSLLKVHSPYCVRVFGFEVFEGHPALVLELVKGFSLFEILKSEELDEDEILEIGRQILCGLRDLSQVGLIHGDLSPSNILLSTDGKIQLIDFGLTNRVRNGVIYATPSFLDPSVLRGATQDEKTDRYALARVLEYLSPKNRSESGRLGEFISLLTEENSALADFMEETSSARLKLGQKARRCLLEKEQRDHSTKAHTTQLKDSKEAFVSRICRRMKKPLIASVVSLLFFALPSASSKARVGHETMARVMARTQKWYLIQVGKHRAMYPPFSLYIEPGSVQVRWKRAGRYYQRSLTISEGENILLEDSFFEP